MNTKPFLLLALVGVIVALPLASRGATTSNLTLLMVAEDSFYNYDFTSKTVSSSNVDWPVCLVFYGNADVNKVKNIYWGVTILANTMYAYLDDGQGFVWDEDRGTKGVVWSNCTNSYVWLHMRVYAPNPPDYLYNIYYGKYVIATAHYDQFPLESWSGYTECAEKHLADIAKSKGYTVYQDLFYFYNYEPYRIEGNHIWLNNGYATYIYVP
ncbi:hypothetical protein TCARB_1067 [Thermofilum adornatum 1505]|uniref:Uncharacterized protein n=1 Tax=Thermofilum adornatum 1505 TaxID=697581 RepID=A0A3G1A7N2_9CREN|nr:hypothetical protein [Thermofilum adornatum]AJB42115.1 hypothetical protein TCARB_1067 [Thermofilum adornatum 1505]